MYKEIKQKYFYWTIPGFIFVYTLYDIYFWSALGLIISAYFLFRLINNMGDKIPIIELMTSLAAIQWIVSPYIDYHNSITHYKYHMYVPEEQYMSFVVPAVIAFWIGTLFFRDNSDLENIKHETTSILTENPKLPYVLIIIGLLIPFISSFVPVSLRFVFFLLSNIKYIGVIYLLFSKRHNRWPIFWGIMLLTAMASIASGMFHDLLLWSMLIFTFIAKELNLNFTKKFALALLGLFIAVSIQSVKFQYRELVWQKHYTGNKTALFLTLVTNEWSNGSILTPTSEADANIRLNQGWIISAIIKNIPKYEPYAGGSTITDAISASLLPRFLVPNKKIAGGQDNFRRYTGLQLGEGTSMGISIVGEGYANYGKYGGILFMLLWGVFIGWVWEKLGVLTKIYPTLFIWTPILFLQVVKAETELVVVLNHLIKASILVFGLLWFIRKQWGIRL